MARNSYQDYLNTFNARQLDSNGRFRGPQYGVNYLAEGLTPQQFYDFQNQMVGDPMARDGADGGQRARGVADASWIPGAQNTGAAAEFWGSLLAAVGGTALAGGFGSAGAGAGFSGIGGTGGAAGIGSGTALGGADVIGAGLGASESAGLATLGGAGEAASGFSGIGGTGGSAGIGSGTAFGGAGSAGGAAGGIGLLGDQSAAETARLAGMNAGTNTLGGISPGSSIGSSSMLDTAGQWLRDNPTLARLGGAALGAATSRDSTTSNSSSRDPWAPAQPYLLDNLATNAAMAEHYRARPFSDLQQQQYQGLFNTLANNQANAPGLLANASSFGQSNRGRMPAMQGLISGTQAPAIDWSQYANIGRRG